MTRRQSCSHCHEMNTISPGRVVLCRNCRHRADRPRLECDCRRCADARKPAPEPLSQAEIDEALALLHARGTML